MPIRLCACGFSGAMRTALRACTSASARRPCPAASGRVRWWPTKLLGSSATMRRISASAAAVLALRLADFDTARDSAPGRSGASSSTSRHSRSAVSMAPCRCAWIARSTSGTRWRVASGGRQRRRAPCRSSARRAGRCRRGTSGGLATLRIAHRFQAASYNDTDDQCQHRTHLIAASHLKVGRGPGPAAVLRLSGYRRDHRFKRFYDVLGFVVREVQPLIGRPPRPIRAGRGRNSRLGERVW